MRNSLDTLFYSIFVSLFGYVDKHGNVFHVCVKILV